MEKTINEKVKALLIDACIKLQISLKERKREDNIYAFAQIQAYEDILIELGHEVELDFTLKAFLGRVHLWTLGNATVDGEIIIREV